MDAAGAAHLEIGENSSDVFFKAHVNHPVGLIQGQVAADVQAHHLLLEQVHQSARGGYHHVDAAKVGSGEEADSDGEPAATLEQCINRYAVRVFSEEH